MPEEIKNKVGQGTFAKLYDVQEELNQRQVKPLGRPPKKIRRKPTTVHLTQNESRTLSQLQLLMSEHFSANRSEIVGIAIELLASVIEEAGGGEQVVTDAHKLEEVKLKLYDFIKS